MFRRTCPFIAYPSLPYFVQWHAIPKHTYHSYPACFLLVVVTKRYSQPIIGVKMNKPKGDNNGTVSGHEYFKCADKHGLLIAPDKVRLGHATRKPRPPPVPVKPRRRKSFVRDKDAACASCAPDFQEDKLGLKFGACCNRGCLQIIRIFTSLILFMIVAFIV